MDFDMAMLDWLPHELLICIWEFFPIEVKMWTNKRFYLRYHHLVVVPRYESFIRMVIRNNYTFLFNIHIEEQYDKWLNAKRWFYDDMLFANYLDFQLHYARQNDSKEIEITILERRGKGYTAKKHKTTRHKYCKWTS